MMLRITYRLLMVWAAFPLLSAHAQDAAHSRKCSSGNVLNLFEKHKDDYAATDKPAIVEIGSAQYLSITGKGEPGGAEFQKKMGALYAVAYGLKMKSKFAGKDYMVAPAEGLWWGSKNNHDFFDEPRETWNWKLIIRTPDFITDKDLRAATEKSSNQPGTSDVTLETLAEGKCVQIMHIGPYDQETQNINTMLDFAKKKGLKPSGPHHEIYLSAPGQVPPEEMRTILRQPVK